MKTASNFIFEIFYQVVLALAIFMLIYVFLLQPHQVRGRSMEPSFENGEYILTDKLSYRVQEPKRGDTIVFAAPPTRREDFIKRVIGVPGEVISLREGWIWVNNKRLEEIYISRDTRTLDGPFLGEGEMLTLLDREYFVMGDNRSHSSDSRTWGVIKKQDIVGRAWFVYWPPTKIRIIPTVTYAGF